MANENIQELKFQVGEAWKGVYSSSTAYGLANVVQDATGLSIYRSMKSGNVGHPVTDRTWWFCIIDMSSIKEESDRIAALNEAIAQDEALRVAAEELRQQHEAERVEAETQRNETEQARISAEQARVNAESARATAEQQRITAEQGRVSAESARVQAEQARALAETLRANAEDARAAAEINRNAAEQQRIANEQARETQYASDHTRAEADHETAASDHTQAEQDHTQAEEDHTQAGDDHTRAESDHTTAASDHTQAGSDHTTAAADHTQAGQDHTRAESDHTRAESDHAAVELYVDSLGAFDISAYHATGGVLAKYADLTAALGTNGANIPEAIRKGGMSVKFVLSSDNKYVQDRCMAQSFTTDITQWQGVDDVPTAGSKNLVESGGVYNRVKDIKNTMTNTFYITDYEGNVICKVDSDGISSVDLKILYNESLRGIKDLIDEFKIKNIYYTYSNCLYVTDLNGYVMLKVDSDGVHFANDYLSCAFKSKILMSLGDSLGTSGLWQERIAELTGMSFDKDLNYNGNDNIAFCVGGTSTAQHPNGGCDRAIRLVDYVNGGGDVDVVMLENINDINWFPNSLTKEEIDSQVLNDEAYFESQFIEFSTGASTYGGALSYIKNNISTITQGYERKIGTDIIGSYQADGKKLTISSGASQAGVMTLTVCGDNYGITIENGDTISDIITKILEIDYSSSGCYDTKSGNNAVLFRPNAENVEVSLSVNVGNTGISTSVEDASTAGSINVAYMSRNLSLASWEDPNNWVEHHTKSLVSIYKGFIEYLCENLINVQFYWFIPTRFDGVIPSTKKDDGTIDFDAYKAANKKYETLVYIQKKVCEYYSIPVIDLHNEGGINVFNQLAYYTENGGVHPKANTYAKWAERAIKFMY